jgi:8-oxo-dGTP diphosphatase
MSDRLYPARPLAGVGAVVWNGRQVLLERRGHPPAQDTWAFPGGLIELGETAEAAIVREVREECGIEVRPGPILGLFEPIQRDPDGRVRYQYVVIDFLAFYVSGELAIGDDAADAHWVTPAELDRYDLTPLARDMIDRALRQVPI